MNKKIACNLFLNLHEEIRYKKWKMNIRFSSFKEKRSQTWVSHQHINILTNLNSLRQELSYSEKISVQWLEMCNFRRSPVHWFFSLLPNLQEELDKAQIQRKFRLWSVSVPYFTSASVQCMHLAAKNSLPDFRNCCTAGRHEFLLSFRACHFLLHLFVPSTAGSLIDSLIYSRLVLKNAFDAFDQEKKGCIGTTMVRNECCRKNFMSGTWKIFQIGTILSMLGHQLDDEVSFVSNTVQCLWSDNDGSIFYIDAARHHQRGRCWWIRWTWIRRVRATRCKVGHVTKW